MSTQIKFLAVLSFVLFFFSSKSFAQDKESSKTEFSIEIDPFTFVEKGYGVHLRIKPRSSDHLLIGLGTYAQDFPSVFVNINEKNRDKNWKVRLNQAYGLFGEYHFTETNKRFFIGSQVSLQEYKIEQEDLSGSLKYNNLLLMAYGGYTLQPFQIPLYFKFWGGVGYTTKVSGENVLNGREYDIAPVIAFGALHIGYTF